MRITAVNNTCYKPCNNSVSFGNLTKAEFELKRITASNRFKIPLEKIKTEDDLTRLVAKKLKIRQAKVEKRRERLAKQEPSPLFNPEKLILPDGQKLTSNGNNTDLLRGDLNWVNLQKYLTDRYKYYKNVNTIVCPCSNGSEAFSYALIFKNALKQKAKKFFPIKAYDLDQEIINTAEMIKQKGVIKGRKHYEFEGLDKLAERINFFSNGTKKYVTQGTYDFGNYVLYGKYNDGIALKLSPEIRKPVEFEQGDLIEIIDNIKTGTPVIFSMRNIWHQVDKKNAPIVAQKLYQKLPKRSSVIIGFADYQDSVDFYGSNTKEGKLYSIANALIENGFTHVKNYKKYCGNLDSFCDHVYIFEKN